MLVLSYQGKKADFTLRVLIFANFANFGQFRENFFREKSKWINSRKLILAKYLHFRHLRKINSVLKFAKKCNFLAILNHQIL